MEKFWMVKAHVPEIESGHAIEAYHATDVADLARRVLPIFTDAVEIFYKPTFKKGYDLIAELEQLTNISQDEGKC